MTDEFAMIADFDSLTQRISRPFYAVYDHVCLERICNLAILERRLHLCFTTFRFMRRDIWMKNWPRLIDLSTTLSDI